MTTQRPATMIEHLVDNLAQVITNCHNRGMSDEQIKAAILAHIASKG